MNKKHYIPNTEIIEFVTNSILSEDPDANNGPVFLAEVVEETIKTILAELFGTIARCEAHEDYDVTFPITEEGEFTDDFQYAILERITLEPEVRNKFFFLLAGDLYNAIMTENIGGKWGFLCYSNGEIFVVIKIRRPTPTARPDWVKARLIE